MSEVNEPEGGGTVSLPGAASGAATDGRTLSVHGEPNDRPTITPGGSSAESSAPRAFGDYEILDPIASTLR